MFKLLRMLAPYLNVLRTNRSDGSESLCFLLSGASGLNEGVASGIWTVMATLLNLCDRTRLRERFFGATHAVLARL